MLYNYPLSFQKNNHLFFSFYYLISIVIMNYCICSVYGYDTIYSSEFGDEKTVSIDSEEIIRRKNVADTYLKENINKEKDWIETYHESFLGRHIYSPRNIIEDNSVENEHRVGLIFSFQNSPLSSLKIDDSVRQYESFFGEKNSGKTSNDETDYKETAYHNLQDSSTNTNPVSFKNDNLSKHNYLSTKISESSKLESKSKDKSQIRVLSNSNELTNSHTSCKVIKNKELDLHIKNPCILKNEDRRLNEFKNISGIKSKTIQIMIKNSKSISEKYLINSETLTLTEFQKLKNSLALLSSIQRSKNNVYSVNRMKVINSIDEVTTSLQQENLHKGKCKYVCKFPNDITNQPNYENNKKKSTTDFKKRVGHGKDYRQKSSQGEIKDSSLLNAVNNEILTLPHSLRNTDFFQDSEILRRRELVSSFVSSLSNNQENWIETYHNNDLKRESKENLFFSSITSYANERKSSSEIQKKIEQNYKFSTTVYSQEQLYIIRWINKLHNKLKNSLSSYSSISFLVSDDLHKILRELSEEFDIVAFDELVTNIISNITLHNKFEITQYFDSIGVFIGMNSNIFYIFVTLLICCVFLYSMCSNTKLKGNLYSYRIILINIFHIKWIFIIILLGFTLFWHGYKMYQQKIAEKHSVMSRVVPSYCESILVRESGVLAHFKEYLRKWNHDEDCKKYYEAVMVDPSLAINPFSIGTDLLSDTIFQLFQPVARNMNSFYKALTYDLSYIQQIFIFIVTFLALIFTFYFCLSFLAFCCKYKVNFPLHLGSVEPTEFCVGSKVEEVEDKENSFKDCINVYDTSLVDCSKTENQNYIESSGLSENTFRLEHFKDLSKQCIEKASRIRHNSI